MLTLFANRTGDGTCSVAINIEQLFTVGHASYTQIKEAAQAVFNVCAASLVSTGGLAHIIGSDNHLYITLSKTSYPNVECVRTARPPSWLPCQIITESIETTKDIRSFGPGAQVNLPWISQSSHCRLAMYISPRSQRVDIFSWYKVWEQATAIMDMCIATGKSGHSTGNGENKLITIDMYSSL